LAICNNFAVVSETETEGGSDFESDGDDDENDDANEDDENEIVLIKTESRPSSSSSSNTSSKKANGKTKSCHFPALHLLPTPPPSKTMAKPMAKQTAPTPNTILHHLQPLRVDVSDIQALDPNAPSRKQVSLLAPN
jgi:hypothetical protein